MLIHDGTGFGYAVKVDSDNRIRAYSVIEPYIVHSSEDEASAYIWTATADWGADKNTIWLRNDSTTNLLAIEKIWISPAAACQVEIGVGTGNTVGGTTVTGANLQRGNGNAAAATCRHTNTNCDAMAGMTIIHTFWASISNNVIDFQGALLLQYYREVGVNFITDVGSSTVTIIGYFHS